MIEIDRNKIQVFFFTTPCPVPIVFASHPFIVINEFGMLSRYEVLHCADKNNAHLYIDHYEAFQGLPVIFPYPKFHYKAKLLAKVEGDRESLAAKVAAFVKESNSTYPYKYTYSFIGINSNTYIFWILKHFPELSIKLPWNSFGRKV